MDFPLTNESYQVVQGQNGGVYSGPSFTATLTGKKDFTGLGAFAKFSGIVRDSLKNKDYPMLERLLSIMNVGKIIHNTDGYIYKNFPTYPYTTELKEIFPDQESMSGFIQKLDYKKNIQVGNEFNLFSSTDGFLPHFYTSRESIVSGRTVDNLPRIFSSSEWQTRSVIFLVGQNVGKEMMLKKILDNDQNLSDGILSSNQSDNIPDDSMITSRLSENSNTLPVLEFKKIDPIKYRVRVHGASGVFPLIFSESFHDGWKVYLNQNVNLKNRNDNLGNYKILDGNAEDQATKDELQNYIAKSYITDLGSGSNKTIKHKEWVGGKEQLDYMEKYNVDFVSKNFQGSIQNDNLPNGNIFETWFQKPLNNNNNHLMANGYANSWVIDTDEICANSNVKCIKNADGTYDFELVVEFWPQRLFYIGLVLSGVALLGCFIYLGYGWRRRNKSCKYYYSDF